MNEMLNLSKGMNEMINLSKGYPTLLTWRGGGGGGAGVRFDQAQDQQVVTLLARC